MAVNLQPPRREDLLPVAGVELGWAEAGIRKPGRKDLLVIRLASTATVAGVFTRNRFAAAPVQVCREHLDDGGPIRALVVNTGNANAGTGAAGLADARATCEAAGRLLGIAPQAVLPFSTGVIMEPLPVDRLVAGLPQAVTSLAAGSLARGGRGDHDDRYAAQGRLQARHHRWPRGHDHRHRQRRRDDPPQHGDDAGLYRHGCGRAARHPAVDDAPRGRSFVQSHHGGRRHVDQ